MILLFRVIQTQFLIKILLSFHPSGTQLKFSSIRLIFEWMTNNIPTWIAVLVDRIGHNLLRVLMLHFLQTLFLVRTTSFFTSRKVPNNSLQLGESISFESRQILFVKLESSQAKITIISNLFWFSALIKLVFRQNYWLFELKRSKLTAIYLSFDKKFFK